jgi:hypothetical protein
MRTQSSLEVPLRTTSPSQFIFATICRLNSRQQQSIIKYSSNNVTNMQHGHVYLCLRLGVGGLSRIITVFGHESISAQCSDAACSRAMLSSCLCDSSDDWQTLPIFE